MPHSNIQWWERRLIQYDSAKDTKLHENKLQWCFQYSEIVGEARVLNYHAKEMYKNNMDKIYVF
jgi:hypothetical protein